MESWALRDSGYLEGVIFQTLKKNIKIMEEFTQHDWNHLHDSILHATWSTTKKKSTKEELVEIFNKMPEYLKEDAYKWGMSDTEWRDNFIKWYMKTPQ